MADRGFTIQNGLAPLNVSVNIPSFLDRSSQLSIEEVIESQSIASVQIHVERPIARIKKYKVLNKVLLSMRGSVNQI